MTLIDSRCEGLMGFTSLKKLVLHFIVNNIYKHNIYLFINHGLENQKQDCLHI